MAGLRAPVRPLPGPEQRNVNYISSLLDMSTKDDLFSCSANFSGTTKVDCLEIRSNEVEWLPERNAHQLKLLAPNWSQTNTAGTGKHVVIFATLSLDESGKAHFRSTSCLSQTSIKDLMDAFGMSDRFLPNLLGSPDYWASRSNEERDNHGNLLISEFYCQHPRWAMQDTKAASRAPLSVYTHQHKSSASSFTVVAGPSTNGYVQKLKEILQRAALNAPTHDTLFEQPLEVQYLVSRIVCESAKIDVFDKFRSKMFTQLDAIDALLSPENKRSHTDRKELAAATIKLQEISKDVNKLIADADCAIRLQEQMLKAHESIGYTSMASGQDLTQSMTYLVQSMDKQKMYLHSYRVRKDIAMSLVFNLVTQRDAESSSQIAKNMQRDGSSMKSIALLTMLFLPGTFTATLLSANLFSTIAAGSEHVSRMWQIWIYSTVPLTFIVVAAWLLYVFSKDRKVFLLSGIRPAWWQWGEKQSTDVEKGHIVDRTPISRRNWVAFSLPFLRRRWATNTHAVVIEGVALHASNASREEGSAGKGPEAQLLEISRTPELDLVKPIATE